MMSNLFLPKTPTFLKESNFPSLRIAPLSHEKAIHYRYSHNRLWNRWLWHDTRQSKPNGRYINIFRKVWNKAEAIRDRKCILDR